MNYKKLLSLVLIALMVVGNMGYTYAAPYEVIDQNVPQIEKFVGTSLTLDPRVQELKPYDEIRIVVELEDAPVIDTAIDNGVRLEELAPKVQASLESELMMEQAEVKNDIKALNIDITYHNEFVNVFNGFSATTTYREAQLLEALPNVKRVVISTEYFLPEPQMTTSGDIINTPMTWDLGYKGEGMLIAILDTGVDPRHNDMQKITNPMKAIYESASELPSGLPGTWFNMKVPYGYNYYDNNLNTLNASSHHGMHVAGTAAANGVIKGVAPEAQILAMKVFGDDPNMTSTFSDIYVKAIEDSLILGADAINMSLGSTASFLVDETEDPARVAIRNASESGVIVSVSAGNSNKFGSGADAPYSSNPDYGVVGSPSLNPETLSVASVENTNLTLNTLNYAGGTIPYMLTGDYDPITIFEKKDVPYVYCGIGQTTDFVGKDVKGKVALIQRGTLNFGTKVYNAQLAGAIGVIIFNNPANGDVMIGMSFGELEDLIKIPSMFVGVTNGTLLKDSIADPKTVNFTGEKVTLANLEAGKISSFSSWGVTPNLDFKPEITAPGGQIYSTLQDNRYGLMSGTSMAAPHATGGAALVLQRLDSEFNSLTSEERYTLAKNLLMSTADPIVDKGPNNIGPGINEFTSPRRQGAGVMDLYGATTSNAVVVDPNTGISKVDLDEIDDITTFQVELQNFGSESVTYEINGTVQTDLAAFGYIYNEPQGVFIKSATYTPDTEEGIYPIAITKNDLSITEVTVPANSKVTIDVTVDLTNAVDWAFKWPLSANFENGTFIEGFLRFEDKADVVPTIGIPYVGFYGEWDDAPILDVSNYEADAAHPQFYGSMNGLAWLDGDNIEFLGNKPVGYDKDDNLIAEANINDIAFSPNGDGLAEHIRAIWTFLRNAKEVQVKILDANKKVVRNLSTEYYVRKNYYDTGSSSLFKAYDSWTWDGKINNKIVEGQYYYQISSKVDFEGAEWQVVEYPVLIDLTAPVIEAIDFNQETKLLTITGSDNDSINNYKVIIGDKVQFAFNGVLDLTDIVSKEAFVMTIVAEDNACNQTLESYIFNDTLAPKFRMPTPEPLGIFNTSSILFAGTIEENMGLESLLINNLEVLFDFDTTTGLYNFSQSFEFADGSHDVPVSGTDVAGNAYDFERRIFVDTAAPVIEMTQVPLNTIVGNEVTSIQIAGNVSDNYTGLVVNVNGNMLYNHETDVLVVKEPTSVTYTIEPYTVELTPGENIITVEAKDYAGNVTQVEYKVYRKLEVSEKPVVVLTVAPEAYVSSERPAIIHAVADVDVTWDVKVLDARGTVVTTFTSTGMEFNGSWAPADAVKLNGEYSVVVKATKNGVPLPVIDFTETPTVETPVDVAPPQVNTPQADAPAADAPAAEAPQIVIQSQEDLQLAPPVVVEPIVVADFSTEITKTFTVYNYPVLITGVDLLKEGNNVVVEAELENLGPSAKDVMLFVQVKNAAGKVVNIATARVSGLADGARINLGSGFGLTAKGAYTVDVFVWFGWDAPTPLSAPVRTVFTIE